MKILALGATGAIGSQLVAALAPRGHDLFVTSRRKQEDVGNLRYIQGNARDGAFLLGVLQQRWDVIVDFMVYDSRTFESRVEALLAATGQYFFVSSARVFAETDGPITEQSPRLLDVSKDANFLATDEYALSKARQENQLRVSGRKNWTIVRPYITFGENRFQLGTLEKEAWLYRASNGRSIVFCDSLMDKWTTLTDGRHVAGMIAALVGNSAALGEDFNLTGQQALTWKDILSVYLDGLEAHLERRPRVVQQDLKSFCNAARSVPQVMYDRIFHRRFDPSKIGDFFDLETVGDSRRSLEAEFRSQLTNKNFLALDARGEALRDVATHERTALSEFHNAKQKIRYLAYRNLPLGLINKLRSS